MRSSKQWRWQRALVVVALLAIASTFLAGRAGAEILRLRSGEVLIGTVSEPDEDGFTFTRMESGATFRVRWEEVNQIDARRLRIDFGFENLAEEQVMMDAIRLTFLDGKSVLCHTIDKSDRNRWRYFVYEQPGVPVARHRIRREEAVRIPADEIYTLEQIYQKMLAAAGDALANSPQENLRLARLLERVLDYDHAKEHYEKARELDPQFAPNEIAKALARLPAKMKLRDQDLKLAEIVRLMRREQFDLASSLCEEFETSWPDSPKKAELERRRAQIESNRAAAARNKITARWYRTMMDLCEKVARDKKTALDAARDFALGKLSDQIADAITEDLRQEKGGTFWAQISSDDVRRLFKERLSEHTRSKRQKKISFGPGTFLLGKGGAAKGIAKIEERLQRAKEKEARAREQERLKRQNQRNDPRKQRGRSRSRQDNRRGQIDPSSLPQPPTPEQWWAKASREDKRKFLLALYAERGGDMEMLGFDYAICPRCRGTGQEVLENQSARTRDGRTMTTDVRIKCRRCHELGFDRIVRFW